MHSHNGHRSRLHLHDDLAQRPLLAMVLSNSWLWLAASLLDAQLTGVIVGWLSPPDLQRSFEYHSIKTFARTRAYKLCGCLSRAIFVFERALTSVFDYWISLMCVREFIKVCWSTVIVTNQTSFFNYQKKKKLMMMMMMIGLPKV